MEVDIEAVGAEDVVDVEVEVSIFVCARFCKNRPKSYVSLLIGQNRPEKSNTYFQLILTLFQEDRFPRNRQDNGRLHGIAPHGPP